MSKRKPKIPYDDTSRNKDVKEMVRRGVLPLTTGLEIAPTAFSTNPGYIVDTVFNERLPESRIPQHGMLDSLLEDNTALEQLITKDRGRRAWESELILNTPRFSEWDINWGNFHSGGLFLQPRSDESPMSSMEEQRLQTFYDRQREMSSKLANRWFYPETENHTRDVISAASLARQKGLPNEIAREIGSFF